MTRSVLKAVLVGAALLAAGCSSSKESIATGKGKGRGLSPGHARPERQPPAAPRPQ
jgi:hypothetical protein